MRNPIQAVANQFLRATPLSLLFLGISLALLDVSTLYMAARKDRVLYIPDGVGLLQDYGLFSAVISNAILLYIARRYYEVVCSIRTSKALTETGPIEAPLSVLSSMVKMQGKYIYLMYLFVLMGTMFWAANTAIHIFGNPVAHWGHKVFDSTDHRLSFYASRLHNAYTWLVILPLVTHIVIFTSVQLRRIVNISAQQGILRYDLLNPDQRGGFLFIERSHVLFNALMAIAYVQITIHIGTFVRMNVEHLITYSLATFLLIFGNKIFLGGIYSTVHTLRLEALNRTKENVYKNDALSFEILKYCYERRINRFSIVNVIIKLVAIGASAAVKLSPLLSKTLS